MTGVRAALAALGTVLALAGVAAPAVHGQDATGRGLLAALDFDDPTGHRLANRLTEISGLTVLGGRLLGHDDERGIVYELDPATGDIVRRFQIGERPIRGDFEGIANVSDTLYLVTSGGSLVRFHAGEDRTWVGYEVLRTAAGELCEIEGLEHDPARRRLLLACKTPRTSTFERRVVVLAFSLESGRLEPTPAVSVPWAAVEAAGGPARFHPSGILLHTATRSLLLVAARERAIVEIAPDGTVLAARRLARRHRQTEGIAWTDAHGLVLVDEGGDGRARMTLYRRTP